MSHMEASEKKEDLTSLPLEQTGETSITSNDAERKVLSKFDKFVMPQMAILVLFAYLDRTNIGNARVFGFEEDTGMHGTQFNDVSMYFYISYVIFETPWVLAVKKFGPGRVLAIAIISWSAITLGTGFVHSYGQVIACRVLLGFFEAGLFPSLMFVISQIYPPASQGKRMAVLYVSIALSGALGGLIAYGIQSMGARHGLSAWRWLFIIEGAISLLVGAICWLSLPSSPETAWFLNAEEKVTMKLIKERNNPFKETVKFSWKQVGMAVTDPLIWLASIALFCSSIALFGFGTFLPTLLKGLDYTSLQANYLSIPVYVLASIFTGATTYVSDRLNRRAVCLIHSPLLVIAGYAIAVGTGHKGAGFFAMFLVGSGVYSFNTVVVTWISNNVQPDYKRSVAIATIISIGNASGMAASQIYPIGDAPRYVTGNAISLGGEVIALVCIGLIYGLLKWRMKQKEKALARGDDSNGKEGDQSLEFKYVF
ncbi:allantoate transport protein [Fusarium flagelliforme]|uniref:Allantoate transport protein n=1 Tax=Fusarium flagelliforme TaxID=2675880 RepID=A0A395MBY9_9HYPO|nr:allantoate transport protein [Fusarium flagelliforme]